MIINIYIYIPYYLDSLAYAHVVAVGVLHVKNKYSPFHPIVCHQLGIANTFTGPSFDVINPHLFWPTTTSFSFNIPFNYFPLK